jgi:hypothetical protein
MTNVLIRIPVPLRRSVGWNLSNGTASERIGKDADYNAAKHETWFGSICAKSGFPLLFAGNGFAFGVWSSVFENSERHRQDKHRRDPSTPRNSTVSHDKSVTRSAQDDGFVGNPG